MHRVELPPPWHPTCPHSHFFAQQNPMTTPTCRRIADVQPSRAWKERQSHRTALPVSAAGDGRVRGADRAGQPGWLSPVLLQTHQVGMFALFFSVAVSSFPCVGRTQNMRMFLIALCVHLPLGKREEGEKYKLSCCPGVIILSELLAGPQRLGGNNRQPLG